MPLPGQNKVTPIINVTGINTVGIYTVGVTETAGGTGIGTTTYVRTVLMHNTGLGTCTSSVYFYPHWEEVEGVGKTDYRMLRKELIPNETYYWGFQDYPIILTDREKVVVEITAPSSGGTGIGSQVNFLVMGDENQGWA